MAPNAYVALSVVNLGAPVKYIEPGAFMGCLLLTNIDIPHTVEYIGDYAGSVYHNGVFEDCLSLRSVTFSYNLSQEKPCLKLVGTNTFKNCVKLTRLEFPYSLTTVNPDAFLRCTSLKHLEWGGPQTLTVYPIDFNGVKLKDIAFHGNVIMRNTKDLQALAELETVQFDKYATEIPSQLFENLTSLKTVALDKITAIKSFAFRNCTGLQNLTLSSELEQIETGAFSGCTSLASIEFGENVTTIADCLSNSGITSLTIPDNVTNFALPSNCTKLTTVTIGDGIKYCANGSFEGCNSLTTIKYGKNVTSVNLSPASVRTIICDNPTPPSARNFQSDVYRLGTLTVPVGASDTYRKAQYWKNFSKIIESDISGISDTRATDTNISIENGAVKVESPHPISIYSFDGRLIRQCTAGSHTFILNSGLYIIVTGNLTKKIRF